ncbi:hypothetical protein [Thomasclavelia cocleata]|uniref:hypothetical protein n=1 Tax=Thomasclavelia cocleata TaxID=69824 RepID=UPI00256EA154|nr:hypothetical protein [Thomasclavelia cocleata]
MNETSFKTKVVIGAVIAVLIFIFVLSQGGHPGGLFVFAYSLLAFFCSPWGWSIPNRIVAKWNTDIIIPIPLYIAIKVLCAVFLGWIVFLYDIYKMFIKK